MFCFIPLFFFFFFFFGGGGGLGKLGDHYFIIDACSERIVFKCSYAYVTYPPPPPPSPILDKTPLRAQILEKKLENFMVVERVLCLSCRYLEVLSSPNLVKSCRIIQVIKCQNVSSCVNSVHLGPISQRVTINCTIDINRSSMEKHVLRKLAINHNPL